MYLPDHFAERRTEVLHDIIRRFGFATLVTVEDGVPVATHLPLVLDATSGGLGTLWGHVARPNRQWRGFEGDMQALAVFHGPHAYVSPRWYTTGPAVPTWNYIAVHAYGTPRIMSDSADVQAGLNRLIAQYEGDAPDAYRPDWTSGGFAANLMRGIVAFQLPIARLEGKFKLSQNRSLTDQQATGEQLRAGNDPLGQATGGWMPYGADSNAGDVTLR